MVTSSMSLALTICDYGSCRSMVIMMILKWKKYYLLFFKSWNSNFFPLTLWSCSALCKELSVEFDDILIVKESFKLGLKSVIKIWEIEMIWIFSAWELRTAALKRTADNQWVQKRSKSSTESTQLVYSDSVRWSKTPQIYKFLKTCQTYWTLILGGTKYVYEAWTIAADLCENSKKQFV